MRLLIIAGACLLAYVVIVAAALELEGRRSKRREQRKAKQ